MSKSKSTAPPGDATPSEVEKLAKALQLMEQALKLIDEAGGPDDVGAHLDLAISRVKEWIAAGAGRS